MNVLVERRQLAAWITLDRAEKRNALSPDMLRALDTAIDEALSDEGARSIVVTGSGTAFCAGADLELGRELASTPGRNPFAAVLDKLQSSPKPVIAAVNGAAFGGGLGLIAAADVAIASKDAVFSFSEVRLGLIPAMISVFVLPKIGPHHARRLFTTGRRFDANEALTIGLLHELVDGESLESVVAAECDEISRGGPGAVAAAKRLVFEIPGLDLAKGLDEALDHASALFAERVASDEGREGMAAFREKRSPSWVRQGSDRS